MSDNKSEFPREVRKSDFEGKTIRNIDLGAFNVMIFYFADGSSIAPLKPFEDLMVFMVLNAMTVKTTIQ